MERPEAHEEDPGGPAPAAAGGEPVQEAAQEAAELAASPESDGPAPFPNEEELPAPDQPLWAAEHVERLLQAEHAGVRLWACRRWLELGRPFPPEVAGQLFDDAWHAYTFLDLLGDSSLPPPMNATELAVEVASRLERLDGEGHFGASLSALARLAPADHTATFEKALEREDVEDWLPAIEGLGASGRPEAAALILRFLPRVLEDGPVAIVLGALFRLGDPAVVQRATEMYLEHLEGQPFDEPKVLVVALQSLAIPGRLFEWVEEAMTAGKPLAALEPTADAAAAARSLALLTPERRQEIVRVVRSGTGHRRLQELLATMAHEAITEASRANESFASVWKALDGFVKAVEQAPFSKLPSAARRHLLAALAAVVAKAIRGRILDRELAASGGDRERVLELCRMDEPWISRQRLRSVRTVVSVEDVIPLTQSPDRMVALNARLLSVFLDPARFLGPFLEEEEPEFGVLGSWDSAFLCSCLAELRDAGLSVLGARFAAEEFSDPSLFTRAIGAIATHRARFLLDRYFEWFEPDLLLSAVTDAGDAALASRFLESLRAGHLDFRPTSMAEYRREDLLQQLSTLLALHGLPGSAEEILKEAEQALEAAGFEEEEELDEADEDLEGFEHSYDDPEDDLKSPSLEAPLKPFRREAPKVGRNEPCPCGSGKKHKKCCGR